MINLYFRRETREKEELKKQAEVPKQQHANAVAPSKVAPWCQPSAASGTSLEEIQKAERQKRAEQAALQQQRALQQLQQQQQQVCVCFFNILYKCIYYLLFY